MVKESKARATREDPGQESLVSKKDEINQRTSKIIELLIDTKNSWNGKPAPGIGVTEPTSIKEPLPDETTSTMSQILQMVKDVDSKLKDIDNQQSGYSGNRRRPQPKKQPGTQSSEPNRDEGGLDLSAIASSGVSRFMSHIKAPFQFGDSDKWARLRLLRAASRINSHLEEMQSFVLSSDDMAVPNAVYKAKDLFHIFDNELSEPMLAALRNMPEKVIDVSNENRSEEHPVEPNVEESVELEDSGPVEPMNPAQLIDVRAEMNIVSKQIQDAITRLDTPQLRHQFKEAYNDLRRRVRNILTLYASEPPQAQQAYMDFVPIKDEFLSAVYSATQQDEGFEATANRFTNFLKRKSIEYLQPSSDHMKGLKLRADQSITKTRSSLDELMDALQKSHVNPGSLTSYLKKMADNLIETYKFLFRLGDIHNSRAKLNNYKAKGKDKWPVVSSTDLRGMNKGIKELEGILMKIKSLQESHG